MEGKAAGHVAGPYLPSSPRRKAHAVHHPSTGRHTADEPYPTPTSRAPTVPPSSQSQEPLQPLPTLPSIAQLNGDQSILAPSAHPSIGPAPPPLPIANGSAMTNHYPTNHAPPQHHYSTSIMHAAPLSPHTGGAQGQHALMPFAVPPQTDAQNMLGRKKSDKEVKRRTKSGCLTCRKRRIKCDEGQPTCRNCLKSKRDCLGYDPIFKQQPGPTSTQPAGTDTSSEFATHTYRHLQYPLVTIEDTFRPAHPATTTAESGSAEAAFVHSRPRDPALDLKEHPYKMSQSSYLPMLRPTRPVRHITIEQLFALNDVAPRYQVRTAPSIPPPATQRDVEDFYSLHFAPGLDKIFETTWYSQDGFAQLQKDPVLLDFVNQCREQLTTQANDLATTQALSSLEARLVWQLTTMPQVLGTHLASSEPVVRELLPRIDTLQQIMTGQYLPVERISAPPSASPPPHDHTKYNAEVFWHHLGRLASLRDDSSDPVVAQQMHESLNIMRGLLGLLETRDVIYSIALVRHLGGRLPEFHPYRALPRTPDPNNDIDKLEVARSFVLAEDQKGTSQPLQRLCSMAIRGWLLQKQ